MKFKNDVKQELLVAYVDLCKKLGKIATASDCRKFSILGSIQARYGKLSDLQEVVFTKHPEILELRVPVKISVDDVELYRLAEGKKESRKSNGNLVQNVSTLEYIAQFAKNTFSGKVKPGRAKKSKPAQRIHTLVLSDLHFGADISGEETGAQDYGTLEEARRFAYVIREASTYKEQYRNVTKLKVLLLGDIIENSMHDPRTGATIAEQVARAIHLLTQGIAYLANSYSSVEVECATGNHGRNTSRHQSRAIHQKWDSLETIIYYSVKESLTHLKNVKVNIPKTPLGSYDAFGSLIAYTHGDTTLSPGNPGTKLDIRSLENQVNRINAARPDREEYSVFIYGHTHVPHMVYINNGSVLLGNGSLPPPDDFAVSIGITETNNGQWIFESVKGHPMGDSRLIRIDKKYDKDESLDTIIKPWKSF